MDKNTAAHCVYMRYTQAAEWTLCWASFHLWKVMKLPLKAEPFDWMASSTVSLPLR